MGTSKLKMRETEVLKEENGIKETEESTVPETVIPHTTTDTNGVTEVPLENGNTTNGLHEKEKPSPTPTPAHLNTTFLKSPLAALKVAQVVFTVIFCALVGTYCRDHFENSGLYVRVCFSAHYYYTQGLGGLGFELFVGSITLMATLFFFVLHVFALNECVPSIPWAGIEILYSMCSAFLFFLCWCIHAKYTHDKMEPFYGVDAQLYSQFIAATIFGVIIMILYVADVVFQYKSWNK